MRDFYTGVMAGLSSPAKEIKPRRGQYQLIRLGVKAVAGQRILAKAPTATGKSIAALLMGVVLAGEGKRTVIATYTKILQDQYSGDLGGGADPDELLDEMYIERMFPKVKFTVLKGASNYQCRVVAYENRNAFMSAAGRVQLGALLESAGDPDEIPVNLDWTARRWVAADTLTCGAHKSEDCGYAAARARALVADVVITNHALVLVGGDFPDVFGPHDLLVVDEVHNFPKAAESYGSEIRQDQVLKALRAGGKTDAVGPVVELFSQVPVVEMERNQQWRYPLAGDMAGLVGPYDDLVRLAKGDDLVGKIVEPLLMWFRAARQRIEERSTANLERLPVIPRVEIKPGKHAGVYVLGLLPVDIGLVARRGLRTELAYSKGDPEPGQDKEFELHKRAIVMMSATVGTPGKPSFVADRCGVVPDRVEELSSPLPYPEAMRVSRIQKAAMSGVTWTEGVRRLVAQTRGRSLVLVNSWARVYDLESELMAGLDVNVYRQERNDSRATAREAERFREDELSVMVGTASLFEGVNFPGPTLSQVVLVDMPMVPDVMGERLRRLGRRWDDEFRVPYVALLLEQIFGRLIRAPQDVGVVVTLDEKFTKGWGARAFNEALASYGGAAVEVPRRVALEWLRHKEFAPIG